MADYKYDQNDGKIHTRYSELLRCTPGGIDRVLDEREGTRSRFEGDNMADGTIRHEMWQKEALNTSKLPVCFGLDWHVSHVEHEFAIELLPGVIVHSRPDVVCAGKGAVVDYKTVLDGVNGWRQNLKAYGWRPDGKVFATSKQKQLIFYAYQLGLHGILIREGVFLCEVWNKGRNTILGYEMVRFPITLSDMAAALAWARPRIALLASALEQRQESLSFS